MSDSTQNLSQKKCIPCEGGVPPLSESRINELLTQLSHWQLEDNAITKQFAFKNYYHTMSFVNAIAWIANQQDHHPDLQVGYNQCTVKFTTHAINGLSENDFICAAKIDALKA